MIGTVVGNYKVVEKIGEGGMGAVYKGVDLMLEREVAIKVLKPELGSQPQVVERFRSEAVTLARLNHPNIATLFSFFRQGDFFFMVLEYVKGTTLDRIVEAHGVMTCEQAIPLFCQMLEGIDHAHSLGIIHRDIKPANMMLTESGLLKVLDFGIARALGSARMTRAGNLIGTIEYMSPEQVRGMETDARSDIYSLGMVLYELLTGRVPFASDSEYELMKAQVEQLPTPPREFAPNIPEEVEWAILCATEKNPENRFQTAGAFSEAIVDCVKTAIASGQLAQIDLQRPTGRLNASSVVSGLLGSRPGSISSPGATASQVSGESERLPALTRIAGDVELASRAAHPANDVVKMTRFAPAANAEVEVRALPQASPSVRRKLTWKHYTGGAIGAAVILVVLLLPLSLLLRARAGGAKKVEPSATSSPVSSGGEDQTRPVQDIDPVDKRPVEVSTPSGQERRVRVSEPIATRDDPNTAPVNAGSQSKKSGTANAKPQPQPKPRRSAKALMEGP
jgi:serine/threonine protein kinase